MSKKHNDFSEEKALTKELFQNLINWWKFLVNKWIIILIFGLSGGLLGLVASLLIKPKYTAH